MRVTALELPARWGDVVGQLGRVDRALSVGPKTDLVLLPEASLTGYVDERGDYGLANFGEWLDGPTASRLAALAISHGVHLVGPLIERDGEHVYNAMIGFDPEGRRFLHYRKRHPWYPEHWATEGELPYPMLHVADRTLMLAVCFDVHFLEAEAAAALDSADVLLFPSAWVDDADSRESMLVSLARRHDVAIANANWGVGRPKIAGQGGSVVVGRNGDVVARVVEGRVDAEV